MRNHVQKFFNSPPPQTVTGPAVSGALGLSEIYVQATADCFICISPTGAGVDGNPVSATNGHFLKAGAEIAFGGLNPNHKLGVNTGTIYISTWG